MRYEEKDTVDITAERQRVTCWVGTLVLILVVAIACRLLP